MEEAEPFGLCRLTPHPSHIPHYVTPEEGVPALCPVSLGIAKDRGNGWAGLPRKPKPKPVRKRKPARKKAS